ncbi:uncharacterized protein LOC100370218 isoform X1 [Saccoglossus kowalevskii]|uniref:E3 ubiquitin-protein ligase BRE1-like 2-like n=1 Tax=Saccoglossus kowalevskii TaxID=10224 RepID=A0ABM0GSE9_SACKO|nr:PREDICTED: E3 ubiquitin-protein ligase BRE1-like 2-like [Saccoglossus kowalevskii]
MGCAISQDAGTSTQSKGKPTASVQPQQTKPVSQPLPEEESDDEPEQVEFNEGLLKKWMELEKDIQLLESKGVGRRYGVKAEEIHQLQMEIKTCDDKFRQLEAQTRKEYQDVVDLGKNTSVKQMMSQMQYDEQMAKEKQEYMDALNKQEVANKELSAKKKRLEQLLLEQEAGQGDIDDLKALVNEQDKLLKSIFNNKYGSDAEYKLESELDMLTERQQRILVAKYKWHNARVLLHHATNQLAFSVKRWGDVARIPPGNMNNLYQASAETRNNLIAASQNITSAQRYLNTIKFPYCTPQEMQTLNTAIANIFSDMRDANRHQHAMACFATTHRRAAALVQWFDQVINGTIMTDINTANKAVDAKKRELRAERIKLIKEKIKISQGTDVTTEYNAQIGSSDFQDDPDAELARLVEADAVSMAGDLSQSLPESKEDGAAAPTPLPAGELAPPPTSDDLFGNIEELKKQHEEELVQLEKAQKVNKARADQDLQDKLARRRNRRRKIQQQESEANALMSQ